MNEKDYEPEDVVTPRLRRWNEELGEYEYLD